MGGPVFEHSEYQRRQEEFIDKPPMDSIVILPNNVPSIRSNDTKYPYRANSYLMYLSGWEEPDSTLVLRKISGNTDVALFVKPRDTESEIWEGRIVGVEGAQNGWPINQAFAITDFESIMEDNLKEISNLYLFKGINLETDVLVDKLWEGDILDPLPHIDEMRTIKSTAEIELMKSAASIASDAHISAMSITRPNIGEWEIQASIENHFTLNRSVNSYNPIVGGLSLIHI